MIESKADSLIPAQLIKVANVTNTIAKNFEIQLSSECGLTLLLLFCKEEISFNNTASK